MYPLRVQQVSPSELRIEWDDGHVSRYTLSWLRKNCPCASCKMESATGGGSVTLPILKPGQYELRSIDPIGSYALQFSWGDGHRTGIYTYEHLRQLCECELCVKAAVKAKKLS